MKSYPSKLTTPPVVEIAPGIRGGFAYRQPETGIPFAYNTWAELLDNVARHRQGMSLDLADGWIQRFEDEFCRQPHNSHLQCEDDDRPVTLDTPLAIAGRECWRQLHEFTDSYPEVATEDDVTRARYWMAGWRERIPRFGGCACREDWARLEANFPPVYTGREAFVTWAIQAHDRISKKIGKPIFRPDLFAIADFGGFG